MDTGECRLPTYNNNGLHPNSQTVRSSALPSITTPQVGAAPIHLKHDERNSTVSISHASVPRVEAPFGGELCESQVWRDGVQTKVAAHRPRLNLFRLQPAAFTVTCMLYT